MTRVLVSLAPGVESARVVAALASLGVADVRAPAPELPDVIVAQVDPARLDAVLARATAIPGVVAAERDAFRFTQE